MSDASEWTEIGHVDPADLNFELTPEQEALVQEWGKRLMGPAVTREVSITRHMRPADERFFRIVYGLPIERCDYSWLWPNECAHCLGHELPDDVPVQTV